MAQPAASKVELVEMKLRQGRHHNANFFRVSCSSSTSQEKQPKLNIKPRQEVTFDGMHVIMSLTLGLRANENANRILLLHVANF
jgi:hypothetical protein